MKIELKNKNWNRQRIQKILGIVLMTTLLFLGFRGCIFKSRDEKKIKNDPSITYGKIEKILRGGYKGGSLTAYYNYTVGTVFHQSSRSIHTRKLVGRRFPVVYSNKYPTISRMLIEPDDFEKFDMVFPDSLQPIYERNIFKLSDFKKLF